ncbi:prepilin-type N-terminal cleavage/methylation domain-containing protein [Opitutaceae bacterium TAV4]|nr:prepilin-type N-terminal cleavage/methylation domain-containing protein [Opitutaceae bacterium TAV4]RRK01586.1 prepilin-type N-terminal cleavage/methylation domain-containing protein [Opitutaceae bacterium TAV3]
MKRLHNISAFTLIELLVVIGLIGVLAAGIGIALKTNDGGTALQGAQASLNSMISAARSQAALKNVRAGIFIETTITDNIPDEGFLNRLHIAYESGQGPDGWTATDTPIKLPQGIFIVPAFDKLNAYKTENWPQTTTKEKTGKDAIRSTVMNDAKHDLQMESPIKGKWAPLVVFNPNGLRDTINSPVDVGTTASPGNRIVLSVGRRDADKIVFFNENDVCGLEIGMYGVVTMINEVEGFKQDD